MEDAIKQNKTSKFEIVNYVNQKINQEFEQMLIMFLKLKVLHLV